MFLTIRGNMLNKLLSLLLFSKSHSTTVFIKRMSQEMNSAQWMGSPLCPQSAPRMRRYPAELHVAEAETVNWYLIQWKDCFRSVCNPAIAVRVDPIGRLPERSVHVKKSVLPPVKFSTLFSDLVSQDPKIQGVVDSLRPKDRDHPLGLLCLLTA